MEGATAELDLRIGDRLAELARLQPDMPAVIAPDLVLNFSQLHRLARCYGARMLSEGIRPGQVVSLATADPIAATATVFALSLVGATFVPFTMDLPHMAGVEVSAYLRTPEAPTIDVEREITIDNSWSPRFAENDGSATDFPPPPRGEDIAWILPSAGTTGRTKLVAISNDLLHRRLEAVATDYTNGSTRLLQLFPPSARAFIIRAIAALTRGNSIVQHGPLPFLRSAGVNFVCGSPQQVRLWLGDEEIRPRLKRLQVSGAKLSPSLTEMLLRSFECVEDVYGSNETIKSHVNSYWLEDGAIRSRVVSAGEIQIVDSEGVQCKAGEPGYVRVRTDYMVNAFLGDPGATASHFRDGWFHPGDLGMYDRNGVLAILGRDSDVVNVEGDKISLEEMETFLASQKYVAAASCFEHSDRSGKTYIAACLCLAEGGAEQIGNIWKACAIRFGALAAPQKIVMLPELERTADGVVRRGAARDRFDQIVSGNGPEGSDQHVFVFGENI